MIKILVSCANGAGSSLMMKLKLETVCRKENVSATISHLSISDAIGVATRYDAIFTSLNFVNTFNKAIEAGVKVIGIKNIMSEKELTEKLLSSGLIEK